MKIFLISANRSTEPYPVFPLGLATIANALRTAGHCVEIFDCLFDSDLHERLRAFAPQLVGISLRNIDNENSLAEEWYLDDIRQLVASVHDVTRRARRSRPTVVLGGAGFSIMPEKILEHTNADYGIAGEGEVLIVKLADILARGEKPEARILWQVPPLATKSRRFCVRRANAICA